MTGTILTDADLARLKEARRLIEVPGMSMRMTQAVGAPIEWGMRRLPAGLRRRLDHRLQAVLMQVARSAARTLSDQPGTPAKTRLHTLGAGVSGALAGLVGPWAMLLEVPTTTTIIFRSIAEIARAHGESVQNPETMLACMEVLMLGPAPNADDASGQREFAESMYYAVRTGMARQIKLASADLLAKHSQHSSAMSLFIKKVVERFGLQYTEKLAAQAVPVLGAVGGATVNTIFIRHFQAVARGHFTVRQLERQYGEAAVRAAYETTPLIEHAK